MASRLKLALTVGFVGLGGMMLILGFMMMSNYTEVNNSNAGIGFIYMLVGFFIIMFALGYAISKKSENAPDVPGRPYRINDPARVGTVSREIRQEATLGSSIGASLGSPELMASDFTSAEKER